MPASTDPRTEPELVAFADAARGDAARAGELLRLLDERHPLYEGADSLAVARMRGALLSAVAHHSLSAVALPFVLEELESAYDPQLTAIAAAALRRYPEPNGRVVRAALEAVPLIHAHDAPVRVGGEQTTATLELFRTLRWLAEHGQVEIAEVHTLAARRLEPAARAELLGDLDEAAPVLPRPPDPDPVTRLHRAPSTELAGVELEDHSGARLTFSELFAGHTTLAFFFFTRCGNPAKCPLTVARLGRLQLRIEREGLPLRTAAFTYDPAFDTPPRLLHYARSWAASPGERHRFVRAPRSFGLVREHFELGVGYGPGGPNRHQLEVFIVDRDVTLRAAVTRQRWTEEQLLQLAREVT